jgi:hypothetical protein
MIQIGPETRRNRAGNNQSLGPKWSARHFFRQYVRVTRFFRTPTPMSPYSVIPPNVIPRTSSIVPPPSSVLTTASSHVHPPWYLLTSHNCHVLAPASRVPWSFLSEASAYISPLRYLPYILSNPPSALLLSPDSRICLPSSFLSTPSSIIHCPLSLIPTHSSVQPTIYSLFPHYVLPPHFSILPHPSSLVANPAHPSRVLSCSVRMCWCRTCPVVAGLFCCSVV